MRNDGTMLALLAAGALAAAGQARRGSRNDDEDLPTATQAKAMVIETAMQYAPTYASQSAQMFAVPEIIEQKLWENATGSRRSFQGPELDDPIEVLGQQSARKLWRKTLETYEQDGKQAVTKMRGSRARRPKHLNMLSRQQLAMLQRFHYSRTMQQQARAKAQLQKHQIDPLDYLETEVLGQLEKRRAAWLRTHLGPDIGLNAEWSVSAWAIDPSDPRRGYQGERFVLDNEDDTWSVVTRRSAPQGDGNDEIDEIAEFDRFSDLKRWLQRHASSIRRK